MEQQQQSVIIISLASGELRRQSCLGRATAGGLAVGNLWLQKGYLIKIIDKTNNEMMI